MRDRVFVSLCILFTDESPAWRTERGARPGLCQQQWNKRATQTHAPGPGWLPRMRPGSAVCAGEWPGKGPRVRAISPGLRGPGGSNPRGRKRGRVFLCLFVLDSDVFIFNSSTQENLIFSFYINISCIICHRRTGL